ncbi:hypothetical protein RchiOBHm_Chr7g0199851 [Rosa chinensis]|uniref:Uncharacterized protein n=1 Tax=Rosa chinensis TaxID=74649 RepID=A0A2P6P7I9_ROSCH|nr:hypothetical protein RchiOBHm_Chr7g0199851 [Rosa chinensis]
MRYMKEIVEDTNLEFATKWDRRTNLVYTENDIDEVRAKIRRRRLGVLREVKIRLKLKRNRRRRRSASIRGGERL